MAFTKGHKGLKKKGDTSGRVAAWNDLAECIIDRHAGRFNQIMADFMESADDKKRETGCYLFLQALEYFKPKQSRVTHAGDKDEPVKIEILGNI